MKPQPTMASLQQVVDIAIDAGKEILAVYAGEFEVERKGDGSPLTAADRRADALIHARLQRLAPHIPRLSEESALQPFAQRRAWRRFWLIDPLDGTKGFVQRNGEFTVNIALLEANRPVLGVVYAPLTGVAYYAAAAIGAFKREAKPPPTPIRVKKFNLDKAVMVVSRAHVGAAVAAYRARLAREVAQLEIAHMGSSMKICLVAEGSADVYPRLGPTSEWDTAAAQCILESAGGRLTTVGGQPLQYNKANILNPWFVAGGDPEFAWHQFAQGLESAADTDAAQPPGDPLINEPLSD